MSEFSVDGIGPVAISSDNSINITLPAGFQADSIRIRYRLAPNVFMDKGPGILRSGSVIYFRNIDTPVICIPRGDYSCATAYVVKVRYAEPVKFEPVISADFELSNDNPTLKLQLYARNMGTISGSGFYRIRFTHIVTGEVFSNVYANFQRENRWFNVPGSRQWPIVNVNVPFPYELARLPGAYKLELISVSDENLSYVVAQPFLLKAGRPSVVRVPTTIQTAQLSVQSLNLTPTTSVSLQLTNDFVSTQTVRGDVVSANEARFNVAANTPPGVYVSQISVNGGKAEPYLTTVPSATAHSYFGFVAPLSPLTNSYSTFSDAPTLRAGESLALQFKFIDPNGPNGYLTGISSQFSSSEVALIRLDDPTQRYTLQRADRVQLFVNNYWQDTEIWSLPGDVPKGDYQLIFRDLSRQPSLPHFRKITVL